MAETVRLPKLDQDGLPTQRRTTTAEETVVINLRQPATRRDQLDTLADEADALLAELAPRLAEVALRELAGYVIQNRITATCWSSGKEWCVEATFTSRQLATLTIVTSSDQPYCLQAVRKLNIEGGEVSWPTEGQDVAVWNRYPTT